jgi:hypothetical protein
MTNDAAYRKWTNLAVVPVEKNEEESRLTYFNAGWAGEPRDYHVPPSVLRKVQSFVQQRPAVLHADEVRAAAAPIIRLHA